MDLRLCTSPCDHSVIQGKAPWKRGSQSGWACRSSCHQWEQASLVTASLSRISR